MADGITLNSGSGGSTIATDDDGTAHHQYVKLEYGADNTQTKVATDAPLPVQLRNSSGTELGDNTTPVQVGDGGGSLTIDAPVGTPVFVRLSDGSAAIATLPVSAASLPLPTGAATAAKQPALGTAGTASSDVLTVQGITSMTALKVDGSAVTQPVSLASVPSHAVTNAGTFAVQAAQSGTWNVTVNAAIAAGDNNIGNVDLASALPAGTNNIGDVDVLTQPARAATTDTIAAKLATDALHNGTTALTPKFAAIDAATSGDNTLVAAVTDKKLRVVSAFLVAAGTVNARFESGAGGTALTGQMNLVANTGFVLPFNPVGWFETAASALLNLELSAAVSVDGSLTYIEV